MQKAKNRPKKMAKTENPNATFVRNIFLKGSSLITDITVHLKKIVKKKSSREKKKRNRS